MTLRFLLDTNIVGFHIRKSSAALQRHLKAVSAAQVGLSVVTEMELRHGLARNPALRLAPLVESFLSGITIVPTQPSRRNMPRSGTDWMQRAHRLAHWI